MNGVLVKISVVKDKGDEVTLVSVRKVKNGSPYLCFDVYDSGKKKNFLLHRIRLIAFIGEPPLGKPEVRHINGKSEDNNLTNLEWGDRSEQMEDVKRHGTLKGSKNPGAKNVEYEAVATYVLAHLGFVSKANSKDMTGLSYMQVYKIREEKAWRHVITDKIRERVNKAKENLGQKIPLVSN